MNIDQRIAHKVIESVYNELVTIAIDNVNQIEGTVYEKPLRELSGWLCTYSDIDRYCGGDCPWCEGCFYYLNLLNEDFDIEETIC